MLRDLRLTPYEIDRSEVIQNGESGANVAISFRRVDKHVTYAVFLIAKNPTSTFITAVSVVSE